MFDADEYLSNYLNNIGSTTTTEENTQQSYNTSSQTYVDDEEDSGYTSYQSPYTHDDYTTTQNYTEQTTYNPTTEINSYTDVQEQRAVSKMQTLLIQKDEAPVVNLIKSKEKIHLETRMKIVLSVFAVIVACLLFISVYNFSRASQIQSTFADKQIEINSLQNSISNSRVTYTLISDDDYLKQWAEDNNYVEKNSSNTRVVELGEMYEQETVEDVPSNWFNDVCEFFSKLFA